MSGHKSYGYKKPEARSWDRVHFTVPANLLMKRSIRECIEETLGIRSAQCAALANTDRDLHIICRPSQFARFIILRNVKYNEPNSMACLNMKLVIPGPAPDVIDVSRNPNTTGEPELYGVRNKRPNGGSLN